MTAQQDGVIAIQDWTSGYVRRHPLASLTSVLGEQNAASFPLDVIATALLIGYLLACAHIWRSALESGMLLGVVISFGYFILSNSISRQVLLPS